MCVTRITVQQTRSAIRRHRKQRQTLIGLKLNRIGRIADLPDTPQTRGMIAKVAHLVRIIGQETELDCQLTPSKSRDNHQATPERSAHSAPARYPI